MAFDEDSSPGSFRDAYICNIAMLLYDNTNLDIKTSRKVTKIDILLGEII